MKAIIWWMDFSLDSKKFLLFRAHRTQSSTRHANITLFNLIDFFSFAHRTSPKRCDCSKSRWIVKFLYFPRAAIKSHDFSGLENCRTFQVLTTNLEKYVLCELWITNARGQVTLSTRTKYKSSLSNTTFASFEALTVSWNLISRKGNSWDEFWVN